MMDVSERIRGRGQRSRPRNLCIKLSDVFL
jgi:hypothetical protein